MPIEGTLWDCIPEKNEYPLQNLKINFQCKAPASVLGSSNVKLEGLGTYDAAFWWDLDGGKWEGRGIGNPARYLTER